MNQQRRRSIRRPSRRDARFCCVVVVGTPVRRLVVVSVAVLLATAPRLFTAAADVDIEADSIRRRSLGDITSRSGRGRYPSLWQEFRHGVPVVGAQVTPCPNAAYCSSRSTQSQPLASLTSPWTFSIASCVNLTVMEGYHSGQATYKVRDQGRFLGNTTVGRYSEACWDDPDSCHKLSSSTVGRGTWLLKPGNHSLSISIGQLTSAYPRDPNDGGWFRLVPTTCPCSTRNAACTTAPSSPSKCCSGLVCRSAAATTSTTGPLQCLPCLPQAQKCSVTAHCCSGLQCLPVKKGSTTKVCK